MWRGVLCFLLIAGACFGALRWQGRPRSPWTEIAPGVELRRVPIGGGSEVVALRTNASRIHIATGTPAEAPLWRQRARAIAAVNGGFFDVDDHSLGVRIVNGNVVSRAHGSRWGVFYVRRGEAAIVPTERFKVRSGIEEAVQCGPRLVVDGKVQPLKEQWARRTGIGIQRDGRVVVAVCDTDLSLPAWAKLWASHDALNCPDALNLDGGPSTQLSLKTKTHSLEISSGRLVPDAVVIR